MTQRVRCYLLIMMRGLLAAFLFLVFTSLLLSCSGVSKNRRDDYQPAGLNCITPTDPSCVGAATAGVSMPIPSSKKELAKIFGRCELEVDGELRPRPCTGLKIVLRGTKENEVRTAEIDGYNIVFADLKEGETYELVDSTGTVQLEGNGTEVAPGQPIRIRVRQ